MNKGAAMESTSNLSLPYIVPSQAQAPVTHNEALRLLDALVQLAVSGRGETEPPAEPQNGDRYIVADGSSGDWTGWDGDIAFFIDGSWIRLAPTVGWRAWVEDEEAFLIWNGEAWKAIAGPGSETEFDGLGIRTNPDSGNRLAVKSDAVLFSHDDQTPGTGDMRATLNKAAAAKDVGFVFQNDWSSRALFGLLGSDDLTLKVSPDGASFLTSLRAGSQDGKLKLAGEPFFNYSALNVMGRSLTGTGNSWFGMTVTNTNADNTAKGGAVLTGAPYNNAHKPWMVLGPWGTSAGHTIFYGGGSWGVPEATAHQFYAGTYQPSVDNGSTAAMSITNAGVISYRNNYPGADNTYSLGTSSLKWSVVYAATGTINTSDGRLKDVQGPVPLGLDFIRQLNPVAYRWKTGGHEIVTEWRDAPAGKEEVGPVAVDMAVPKPGARTHYGLIAQQVKQALEAHGITDFAGWTLADRNDPESEQGLRYDQFVPILIKAVQELAAEMNAMRRVLT